MEKIEHLSYFKSHGTKRKGENIGCNMTVRICFPKNSPNQERDNTSKRTTYLKEIKKKIRMVVDTGNTEQLIKSA